MSATKKQYQNIENHINVCFWIKKIELNKPFDPKHIYECLKKDWPNDVPTYLNFCKAAEQIFQQRFKTVVKTHIDQKFSWIVCDNLEYPKSMSERDLILCDSFERASKCLEIFVQSYKEQTQVLVELKDDLKKIIANQL